MLGRLITGSFLIYGCVATATPNLLDNAAVKWGCRPVEGATGTIKKLADGSYEAIKDNAKGYVFLVNDTKLPLTPGKSYRVALELRTIGSSVKGRLMLSMPGSKRRPFPVSTDISSPDRPQTVELEFTAAPDENNLRIHLVVIGQGKIALTRVDLEEVKAPAGGDAFVWQGRDLRRSWKPFGVLKTYPSADAVEVETLSSGGLGCNRLNWKAAGIKAVEAEFRAFDEGGYVKMSWTTEKDGNKIEAFLTRSIPPDGIWHTLVFDVSKTPEWSGTVKALRFSWGNLYASCRVGLKAVRAMPEPNVIPGAAELASGGTVKVDMIKPRGEYRLVWRGERNPGVTLETFGLNGEKLSSATLSQTTREIDFSVPELAAYGRLTVKADGVGYPLLTLENLKPLGLPATWWQKGSWIWSRNAPAPRGNVWFYKKFNLTGQAKLAETAMIGDDTVELWVNGRHFPGGSDWSEATKCDVTAALHPGSNEIVARVSNTEAWGGLLLEMYVATADGKSFRLGSDHSWTCSEGGDTRPAVINAPVFVFGLPPVPPWGLRCGFTALGPQPVLAVTGAAKSVTAEAPARARIVGAGQRTWFEVNGERLNPFYYDLPNFSLAPERKAEFIRNAAKGGNRIVRISMEMRKFWTARDSFDFSALDRSCRILRENAPEAYIMVIVSTYMPDWWLKENPAEATAFHGSEKPSLNNDFQSLASKKWLVDADLVLRRLVSHIQQQPYGSRVIGLCPADGSTWEWLWSVGRGHKGRVYSGYSPAALGAYREFLKGKYHTDAGLASAWHRPGLTFTAAMPPPPARIDQGTVVNLLDPARDRDIMDWFEFRNKVISDDIIHLCHTIKEASGRRWITGTYYGYLVMFSYMQFVLQDAGHLGIHKVATSPDVDFVIGPTIYHWRKLGMADNTMQPDGAFTCHGKPVICELDYRTFSEPTDYERRNGKVDTVEQTAAMMNQGFGMLLTRGLAAHYMDLHDRWFLEPVILKTMAEQHRLYALLPEKTAGLTPVEVCVVSDEVSPIYVKNNLGDGIHTVLVAEFMKRLREAGFAYRHVLLPDILTPGLLPPHKLYILTNTMVMSKEQRSALQERLQKENASLLCLYAPGVFYPDSAPSAAGVDNLTGMKTQMLEKRQGLTMQVEKEFGGMTVFCRTATGPWFPITGGYDFILGKDAAGQVLAAGRNDGKRTIWFSTVPNLPPVLVKTLAARAGVRIYSESGDPVHIGNDFIFLHAKTSGLKRFNLPSGLQAKAVIGPFRGTLTSGEQWQAEAGMTYGFMLVRE